MSLRNVEKSQTLLLNEQSRMLEGSGREIFKFGFGQSPFPPPEKAVSALKSAAHRKEYTPVQGIPELRKAIAAFHSEAEGLDVTSDRVLIAPGSKIIIYAAMAALERADVLVPAPSWVSYVPQARLLGHSPILVSTSFKSRWRVTPEALERAVASKKDSAVPTILILNYPGNPDGLTYTSDELEELTGVFRRHRILVIADEIYGLLNHQGTHQPLALFYPEATITTGGLSKWCGAGGWRLGMGILPESLCGDYKDAVLGIASETFSCAPTPIQIAACEAYQWNRETQDFLTHQRRLLALLGGWVATRLKLAGVDVHMPHGGFYLFPEFTSFGEKLEQHGVKSASDFCAKLLADAGVALLPGDAFGMPTAHLCARLAYVDFDGSKALSLSKERGLEAVLDDAFVREAFPRTEKGVRKMCEWLASL